MKLYPEPIASRFYFFTRNYQLNLKKVLPEKINKIAIATFDNLSITLTLSLACIEWIFSTIYDITISSLELNSQMHRLQTRCYVSHCEALIEKILTNFEEEFPLTNKFVTLPIMMRQILIISTILNEYNNFIVEASENQNERSQDLLKNLALFLEKELNTTFIQQLQTDIQTASSCIEFMDIAFITTYHEYCKIISLSMHTPPQLPAHPVIEECEFPYENNRELEEYFSYLQAKEEQAAHFILSSNNEFATKALKEQMFSFDPTCMPLVARWTQYFELTDDRHPPRSLSTRVEKLTRCRSLFKRLKPNQIELFKKRIGSSESVKLDQETQIFFDLFNDLGSEIYSGNFNMRPGGVFTSNRMEYTYISSFGKGWQRALLAT